MEINKRTIVIKPVPRIKFSGQTHYSNTGTVIEGAQIGKTGYKTGLTKEEEKKYEIELGLPTGTLSKTVHATTPKENDLFWSGLLNLRLNNDTKKPTYFHVETLLDEIKLKCLLENSRIAKNEFELKKMPLAEFYVEDAEAKAKVEEVVINHKMEAIDALRDLTPEEKRGFLKLYGKRNLENNSDSFVNTNLFKEVDADPVRFLNFFNNPDIKLRISIEEMVEAGTLLKKGQYYFFENENIGNSVDAVVAFFKDLKNQSIKIAAQTATKNKKK